MTPSLYLGAKRSIHGGKQASEMLLPAHHLVTHGVVVGMTGSGKTGLVTVVVEEALRAGVPVLVIDVKGDLPNLLLSFPNFDARELLPWIEGDVQVTSDAQKEEQAVKLAAAREYGLKGWGIREAELADFAAKTEIRVITPGSSAGESLHVLSSLERRSPRWDDDVEAARASLCAAVSLILRLLGRDADPAKSREHVILAVLAERRLLAGEPAEIEALMQDLADPPVTHVGALEVNAFM
jgi:hypothetical protein